MTGEEWTATCREWAQKNCPLRAHHGMYVCKHKSISKISLKIMNFKKLYEEDHTGNIVYNLLFPFIVSFRFFMSINAYVIFM